MARVVTRSSRTGHRLKRYRQGAFAEWSEEDVYRPEGIVPGNHYCPSNFFTISMPLVTLPLCRGLRPSLTVEPGTFGNLFSLQIAAFLRNTLDRSIGRSVGQLVKENAAGRFPLALLAIKLALVNKHIAEQPAESDR